MAIKTPARSNYGTAEDSNPHHGRQWDHRTDLPDRHAQVAAEFFEKVVQHLAHVCVADLEPKEILGWLDVVSRVTDVAEQRQARARSYDIPTAAELRDSLREAGLLQFAERYKAGEIDLPPEAPLPAD